MQACSVIRETQGDTAVYLVSGRFEGDSAWELARRLGEESLPRATVDFSRCNEFHDAGVAVLSQALLALAGVKVQLRGLRQHQERVFKCFGVDAAEPARPGEPSGPAREVR